MKKPSGIDELRTAGSVLTALLALDGWYLDSVLEDYQEALAGDGEHEESSRVAVLREEIKTLCEIRKERHG